jgi:uncharacterized protein YndB with AHSA1/START domain
MIDVIYEINATQHQVGTRVLDAGEARTITVTRTYAAALEDVWDACTNPAGIPHWFLPISGELRAGGRYQLEGPAAGSIRRCDKPHRLSATWEYSGEVSWIELWLTRESDGRPRQQLEHIAHIDADAGRSSAPARSASAGTYGASAPGTGYIPITRRRRAAA